MDYHPGPSQGPEVSHLHPSGSCWGWRHCAAPAWHTIASIALQTASGKGAAPAPQGRTPLPRAAKSPEAFLGSGHYWERLAHLSTPQGRGLLLKARRKGAELVRGWRTSQSPAPTTNVYGNSLPCREHLPSLIPVSAASPLPVFSGPALLSISRLAFVEPRHFSKHPSSILCLSQHSERFKVPPPARNSGSATPGQSQGKYF